ncbi:protein indeterminate-domain 12-like [Apium graveolens]|uniref:protein indeterminate-domain 12-like n=1 Tax=Apium graveolens TaxID=4045 RepID=UPI003D793741
MFPAPAMSNLTSLTAEASCAPFVSLYPLASNIVSPVTDQQPQKIKKKRNLPGNPDPDAEVISLSPKTLLATNRFVCEICNKGFQRDQNLQLHRRGHNLPWKLKQRNNKIPIKKKAYVCPEPSCVHHNPSRALGDLTGIKKHFSRKHGEKKWKCEKCSKIYAVQSDWKAHTKTCGTREYMCDCGTLFSRKDSFVTHRAFCDALAEETARLSAANVPILMSSTSSLLNAPPPPPLPDQPQQHHPISQLSNSDFFSNKLPEEQNQSNNVENTPFGFSLSPCTDPPPQNPNYNFNKMIKRETTNDNHHMSSPLSTFYQESAPPAYTNFMMTSPFRSLPQRLAPPLPTSSSAHLSATALLQKAATMGPQPATMSRNVGHVTSQISPEYRGDYSWQQKSEHGMTRDFLGLTGSGNSRNVDVNVNVNVNGRNLVSFTRGIELPPYEHDHSRMRNHLGFAPGRRPGPGTWENC